MRAKYKQSVELNVVRYDGSNDSEVDKFVLESKTIITYQNGVKMSNSLIYIENLINPKLVLIGNYVVFENGKLLFLTTNEFNDKFEIIE